MKEKANENGKDTNKIGQSKLAQLKKITVVVVDTGDIAAIEKYTPVDATTNPSLIFAAAQKPQYRALIEEAVSYSKSRSKSAHDQKRLLLDKLFVNFGVQILKIIPGRVSTEVGARLSFDVPASIQKAKDLIQLYADAGIARERVLIKLASTWEGALAAKELEKEGIHCNMTLMFSLPQAVACAKAKATLVSPFVGRILDWYKKSEGVSGYPAAQDPGVLSVQEIYAYYKKFGYKTEVMGASFRNAEEILELAGCDLLTISPQYLEELQNAEGEVVRKLDPAKAKTQNIAEIDVEENHFRYAFNENAMAVEKLAEGIRNFAKDTVKLEEFVAKTFI